MLAGQEPRSPSACDEKGRGAAGGGCAAAVNTQRSAAGARRGVEGGKIIHTRYRFKETWGSREPGTLTFPVHVSSGNNMGNKEFLGPAQGDQHRGVSVACEDFSPRHPGTRAATERTRVGRGVSSVNATYWTHNTRAARAPRHLAGALMHCHVSCFLAGKSYKSSLYIYRNNRQPRKPIECAPEASSVGREWAEMT